MHRRQIEELKRAEKLAADRVRVLAEAEPADPDGYKRALFEWQSARAALRSAGVQLKPVALPQAATRRSPRREPSESE
ncbi:MAG: hypothetical protein ABI679_12625 [Gemmatimonadota bacterium]